MMTRDEAKKIVADHWPKPNPNVNGVFGLNGGLSQDIAKLTPTALTDILVALGVLKLDEPRTYEERIQELSNRFGIWADTGAMKLQLASVGLKIVEAEIAATSGWQPIETAPKRCGAILIFARPDIVYAKWDSGRFEDELGNPCVGTHWMPLPSPPGL